MRLSELVHHKTKKEVLIRFLIALSLLLIYVIYLTNKFGADGFKIGVISWSAFVMATPIADAGLLLDLPVRLITGIRMLYSEMIVWCIAIGLNIFFLFSSPTLYEKTTITRAFHDILANPWPNWIIILLSALGTFFSLFFGDELLDVVFHHERRKFKKYKIISRIVTGIFVVVLFYFVYRYFLELFGINI